MQQTEFYITVGLWIKAKDEFYARQKAIDMLTTKPISVVAFEPLLDWEILEIE